MNARLFRFGINLWPPFLFTGIHVTRITPDYRQIDVELRLRPWNRNYVGTHFGGSLFAMTDPFWMLGLLHILGRDYYVWDRACASTTRCWTNCARKRPVARRCCAGSATT
jgi:acyl-coenzyme A thioesterase PaaI-like protein